MDSHGGRSGADAIRSAVDQVRAGELTEAEAVAAVRPSDVELALHAGFASGPAEVIATGLGASPGAAVGRAYFSADAAADAADEGELVILVRQETSPEDVFGMQVSAGILTTRGGSASHAALVARGWGIPAVVGADAIELGETSFTVGGTTVVEGDVISIDGSTGEVVVGARSTTHDAAAEELAALLGWADEIRRGHLVVRANADTAGDAAKARELGAEGIGLCRTEHMFLAEDRLPIVRRMILAATPEAERAALEELRVAQRADFAGILEAMDGLPVTVRLLDPPLHEFLPATEELAVKAATTGLTAEEQELLDAARSWHEQNPMLGTRGVRLGVLRPGLYAMQVQALLEAAQDRIAAGGHPVVEVLVPLVVDRTELDEARRWVASGASAAHHTAPVPVGAMIETPRAALLAGAMGEAADSLSFGTNDLTQLTFGFSRDDVEAVLVPAYLAAGLLPHNPFESLDEEGVGALLAIAVDQARAARPDVKLSVCGEHGGDPASIAFFHRIGIDVVSCSPYRVPVARLAAARAVLVEAVGGTLSGTFATPDP